METYKITISFSKTGDYFDYEVTTFEVTTEAVRFTTVQGQRYVFDLITLYELIIGVAK
ncbi:hypothetical protein LCGC14_0771540 [marine sediment metagenome]|uniref:Uncharacterized protein n=1 Tax=marine sediment metagenome TaxID=412755 RepID=A0A0F9SI57_9ZZZZ